MHTGILPLLPSLPKKKKAGTITVYTIRPWLAALKFSWVRTFRHHTKSVASTVVRRIANYTSARHVIRRGFSKLSNLDIFWISSGCAEPRVRPAIFCIGNVMRLTECLLCSAAIKRATYTQWTLRFAYPRSQTLVRSIQNITPQRSVSAMVRSSLLLLSSHCVVLFPRCAKANSLIPAKVGFPHMFCLKMQYRSEVHML